MRPWLNIEIHEIHYLYETHLPKDRNPQFRCLGMWISYRPKCCGPQHLGLYEIHMPKHQNPQHIGLHEINKIHKLLW